MFTQTAFKAAGNGEYDQLADLYLSLHPLLHHILIPYNIPFEERSDILQDVFIKISKKSYQFTPRTEDFYGAFRSWAATITKHHAIDLARGKPILVELPEERDEDYLERENLTNSVDIPDSILTQDKLNLLQEGLENSDLNEREQQVMQLRLDGYSYKEIVIKMNVTMPAVKAMAHRAIVKLRKFFHNKSPF